jgi:ketosteroid isomerase-like protein
MKPTSLYLCLITALLLVMACVQKAPEPATTTEALEQELRFHVIKGMDAWNRHDSDAIAMEEPSYLGFGYRTKAPRMASDIPQEKEKVKQFLEEWFKTMKYYEIELEDFNVEVDGDIGLVWGFFVEDFQEVGKPPERNRIRFSATSRRIEDGRWKILMGHRDIQPFDEKGQYIRKYLESNP